MRLMCLPAIFGLALVASWAAPSRGWAEDVTVFAAASLKTALDVIAAEWQVQSGDRITVSYGGTAQLAKQVLDGAPADLVVFASADWMDELAKAGRIDPATRRDLLGNALVLVAHDPATLPAEISPSLDLAGVLAGGKLAMALVDAVPAGQYGREALVNLGLWASVEASVVQSENVRASLALVARGEAAMGIVYASDAVAAAGEVTVVGRFPATSHRPIVFPAAQVAGAAAGRGFLAALSAPAATAIFRAQGFAVLAE